MQYQRSGMRVSISIIIFVLFLSLQSFTSNFQPARSLLSQKNVESVLVSVVEQTTTKTVLQYSVPEPAFEAVSHQTRNGVNAIRMTMGNANLHSVPTEPEVPVVLSRVILEQGQKIQSIRVIPGVIEELPGTYALTYGETPHPLMPESKITWAQPNENIYNSNAIYPEETQELQGVQHRYGVAIALINVYPVLYRPKSGQVSYFKSYTLEVNTVADPSYGTGVRVRLDRFRKSILTEENPEALNSYIDGSIQGSYEHQICNPNEEYRYLLISGQSLIDAGANP